MFYKLFHGLVLSEAQRSVIRLWERRTNVLLSALSANSRGVPSLASMWSHFSLRNQSDSVVVWHCLWVHREGQGIVCTWHAHILVYIHREFAWSTIFRWSVIYLQDWNAFVRSNRDLPVSWNVYSSHPSLPECFMTAVADSTQLCPICKL